MCTASGTRCLKRNRAVATRYDKRMLGELAADGISVVEAKTLDRSGRAQQTGNGAADEPCGARHRSGVRPAGQPGGRPVRAGGYPNWPGW